MNYPANSPITLIFRFPLRKFALSACLLSLSASIYLHGQTTVYWDVNGTTAGAGGATPGGTWKTSGGANQNWGNAGGTAVTNNWTNGDIAVFSAGSDATGSFTVTLASAPTADSVVIEEGDITFASSTLTLIGSTPSIDVATGSSATFDSKLLGANGLVKDGGGMLVLNNTGNNYTGATLVNAGTLQIGSGANILPTVTDLDIAGGTVNFVSSASTHTVNSLSGSGSLDFGDNIFRVIGTANTVFSGSIADSGGTLRKLGTGSLTLSGNSTFSGALDHNAGIVVVAHDQALGAASSGNDVASGAALHFSGGISVAETDVVIRGVGDGSGVLRSLDGSNTLDAAITLAAASTITTDAGSTFSLIGNITRAGQNLTVEGDGHTILAGDIAGGGAAQLIKTSSGNLTLAGTGANTFAGDLSIYDGTVFLAKTAGLNATGGGDIMVGDGVGAGASANLVYQASTQLPDATAITINSDGRLALGTFTDAVSAISGTGLLDLGTTGELSLGADGGDSLFSGSITGAGNLEVSSTGSLTLGSDISYTGSLTLDGGSLTLSDSELTVTNLVITGNSVIDFAGGSSSLFATNLIFANTSVTLTILNWALATDYFFAGNWAGAIRGLDAQGQLPMNQITFSGWTANETGWEEYTDRIRPNVPEPATYGLLLTAGGLALLGLRRWQAARRIP